MIDQWRLMRGEADSTEGSTSFSNAQIRAAFNMSLAALSSYLPLVEDEERIACVAKQVEYPLDSAIVAVRAVFFKTDKNIYNRVEQTPIEVFGTARDTIQSKLVNQDLIVQFTLHKKVLKVFPALNNYTADSLIIPVLRYANDLDSNEAVFEGGENLLLAIYKLTEMILLNPDLGAGDEAAMLQNVDTIARMFIPGYSRREEGK